MVHWCTQSLQYVSSLSIIATNFRNRNMQTYISCQRLDSRILGDGSVGTLVVIIILFSLIFFCSVLRHRSRKTYNDDGASDNDCPKGNGVESPTVRRLAPIFILPSCDLKLPRRALSCLWPGSSIVFMAR